LAAALAIAAGLARLLSAALAPFRDAARIDPAQALRSE